MNKIEVTPFKPALPVPPAKSLGPAKWVVEASYNLADYTPPVPLAIENLLAIHGMVLITMHGVSTKLARRDGPTHNAINVDYNWTLEQWIYFVTHFDALNPL